MMRTAVFSTALIFGGLLRRLGAVLFGIGAFREKAQRSLMQPRRDAIGRRPDLPITNDGPVEFRLLGPTAVVDPCSDAARWWVVLYPAPDFRLVNALQDNFRGRRGQQSRHGPSLSLLPSCESFEFGAKIREAFLLAPSEWLSPVLTKDALCRRRRELEVPVSEMVKRRAQEQAFPTAKSHAPIFKRSEGFLQFAAGLPTPKIAIKIRMLMRRLFVHRSRMGASWG